MRSLLSLFILLASVLSLSAQQFLNGDFETNSAVGNCDYNLSNEEFNDRMPGVTAFGDGYTGSILTGGEVDIQSYDCYCDPQNGDWCVGIAGSAEDPQDGDAISLELDQLLTPGNEYQLTFYIYGNTSFAPLQTVDVGVSSTPTEFGDFLLTVLPDENAWKEVVLEFEATTNAKYITLRTTLGTSHWCQVDNFQLALLTGADDRLAVDAYSIYPNPASDDIWVECENQERVEIFDLSGRLIRSWKIEGQDFSRIPVDNITSGSYLVVVTTSDGTAREMIEILR